MVDHEGLDNSGIEESLWHGGLYKLDRLGRYLLLARYARNSQNWNELYAWLEAVYYEVDSYLRDNADKEEIKKLYDGVKKKRASCRQELDKQQNTSHNCRGLLGDWELDLRFALKKFKMDMPEKTDGGYLRGAI